MYITCVCVCLSVHVRNSERLKCVCGAVSQNDGHVLSWSYNWMTTDPATVPTPATNTHPNTHTDNTLHPQGISETQYVSQQLQDRGAHPSFYGTEDETV